MFEYTVGIVLFVVFGLMFSAIMILREYERGVIFQLGRFWKVK
jgi:regulator of protease activity HflC (stomatin/prohibitin superfamily)